MRGSPGCVSEEAKERVCKMPSSRRLRLVLLLVALGVVVARGTRRNGDHHSEDFRVPEEQAPTPQEQAVVAHEGAVFTTPQEQVVMTHEEQSLAFLTSEEVPTAQEQDVVAPEGAVFETLQEQVVMTHEEQSLAFLTPEEQHSQAPQVQLPDPTWDSADRHPRLRLLEQPPEPANRDLAPSEPGQGGLPDLGSALR
jgi:hypothetical protein